MTTGLSHVDPRHEPYPRRLHDRPEKSERPCLMTDRHIDTIVSEPLRECVARPPDAVRPPDPRGSENARPHPFASQLCGDAIVEAQRRRHLHGRRKRTRPREGHKERLDTAVQIAAVDVQDVGQLRRCDGFIDRDERV